MHDNARTNVALELASFLTKAPRRMGQSSYRNGEVIFAADEPADSVVCLVQGTVKYSATSSGGKEGVITIFEAVDFVGQECLIGQEKRRMTATALTPCSVLKIERMTMIRMLRDNPRLAMLFISCLVERSACYQNDLVDHLFNNSERRLARCLVRLSNSANDGGDKMFMPRMTQESLAAMVGTTRSRVNYFMNKFRDLGLIEYGERIRVLPGLSDIYEEIE